MQFIESSVFGVRSARISLTSTTRPVHVTLFPMLHVGEPQFYEAVYADALAHDVVLFEGVKSPVVTHITRSYRWLVGSKAMAGLVEQPKLTALSEYHAKLILADLTGPEFDELWRAVPLWTRLALYILAPIIGLARRWFGSRATLAKDVSIEDAPSLKELLMWDPETAGLSRAVLEARDERLIERLREQLDRRPAEHARVAIIYGAGHMRPLVRELTHRYGYYADHSEWLTIFTAD